jgi:hypothetical protein
MRHKDDPGFLDRDDIQFIVLTRDDIPSTVASFIAARNKNTWNRRGGKIQSKIHIRGINVLMVWGNAFYIRRSLNALKNTKNGIKINYEDLCDPNFNNQDLNAFFGRTIQLANPVKPTSGAEYIENWDWFKQFVERWSGTNGDK